ncbi:hypothetical protein ES703_36687 [subsurface metagenome]
MVKQLPEEFWDYIHKRAVNWRHEKIKEVMEKQRQGEASNFEIQMINSWEEE